MHRRPHKLDAQATAARHFASRYSYVSRRIHPGTDHACEYLAGLDDTGKRRTEVFERDGNECVICGSKRELTLRHGGNTKISRCWCPENLSCRCWTCHLVREHGRFPRFGEVNA